MTDINKLETPHDYANEIYAIYMEPSQYNLYCKILGGRSLMKEAGEKLGPKGQKSVIRCLNIKLTQTLAQVNDLKEAKSANSLAICCTNVISYALDGQSYSYSKAQTNHLAKIAFNTVKLYEKLETPHVPEKVQKVNKPDGLISISYPK